jgi:hypothetical protein
MGLKEVGRTGVQVNLGADGVTGIVTQDPESMLHSIGGLTNADGNTAWGLAFTIVGYFTATTDDSQTITVFDSDAPFKFRVLKCGCTLVDDANGVIRGPNGQLSLSVLAGSAVVCASQLKDMGMSEVRNVLLNTTGGEVVSADGSLSVKVVSRVPLTNDTNTMKLLVELTCMRVI